jgi:hypothetical protein
VKLRIVAERRSDEAAIVLVGYIDESYDGAKVPQMFELS